MSPVEGQFFHGIYPSILCPFRPDLTIDTEALAAHAESLAATPGIRGILCNGHAGESAVLSRGEKYRVVEVVRRAIGRKAVLVAGIGQEESGEAAAEGHDAVVAGADAVMVLAPFSWALGHDPEMVTRHHRMIAERADRPMMLFQGSVRSGRLSYPPETLRRLLQLPDVVAIKEGSWETAAYEATRRLVEAEAPHVAVMASGDEHLLSCYVLGSEGSLVSFRRPDSRGGRRTRRSGPPQRPLRRARPPCGDLPARARNLRRPGGSSGGGTAQGMPPFARSPAKRDRAAPRRATKCG